MLNTYKNSPITANDAVKFARLVESNQALLGAAGHYSDAGQYDLACLFEEQAEKALESYTDLASKIARLADAADEKCANVTIPTIPVEISRVAEKHGVRISITHTVDSPFVDVRFIFAIDYIDTYGSRYTALVRLGSVPVEFGDDIISDMFAAAFDACAEASLFDIMGGWMLPSTLRVCETGWKKCYAPASLTLDDAHALAKRAIDHFESFIDELEELTVAPANEPDEVTISRDVLESLNDILAGTVGVHDADVVLDTSDNSVYTREHISATDYSVYCSDDDKLIANICEGDLDFYSAMTTEDCSAFDDADEETRIQIIEHTLRCMISEAV